MPAVVGLYAVRAEKPSLGDNTGDIDRLRKAVAAAGGPTPLLVPYAVLAVLAAKFRQAGFAGVAVVNALPERAELVDFLASPPTILPAMALDLGTTHLEAKLIDLLSGRTLAAAALPNPQSHYGADILTRIHFAARGDGLHQLHRAVIGAINELAARLAGAAGLAGGEIRALAVSGNTTMVHLLLPVNPHHLCREPYIPLVNAPDPVTAGELGVGIHPAAAVWILPSVGSYFGGDLIAGILATGLDRQGETCMLIDVGTNAEVVLGNRDWLIACAGAAGPALEGGVARMGMVAGPGAIEQVRIDPGSKVLTYRTIGEERPRGLCGSGMIDLVANLYLAEMIDQRGKLRRRPGDSRIREREDGLCFEVASATASANGQAVEIAQVDLDALLRSKAAMYAILTTLTNQVGVSFADLARIYVAGAFGRHIDPRSAITLGMLPDLPVATYQSVGNSSLAGAVALLLDRGSWFRGQEIVRKITYVELNVNQEFMNRFSGCRFIPHTDRSLFPSVPSFGH